MVTMALAGLALLITGSAQATASPVTTYRSGRSVPADLFIESVVLRDAELGWHQLCPQVKSQLSLAELAATAQAQKRQDAAAGVTLTSRSIERRPLKQGGALSFYLLTARWAGGATDQRVYAVHTDSDGCVNDVQISAADNEGTARV